MFAEVASCMKNYLNDVMLGKWELCEQQQNNAVKFPFRLYLKYSIMLKLKIFVLLQGILTSPSFVKIFSDNRMAVSHEDFPCHQRSPAHQARSSVKITLSLE